MGRLIGCLLLGMVIGCSQGRSSGPAEGGRARVEVLVFVAIDCPISNAYAPELSRIVKAYEGRAVTFYAVYSDPGLMTDAAREHLRAYELPMTLRMDSDQALAQRVGATVTPEAAVLDREGRVVYLGRIDDLYYGFGKRRSAATTHELRDAIDSVLAGQAVKHPRVPAIGCEIPPLRTEVKQ